MKIKRSILICFGWILFIAQPVFAQEAITIPISDAIINVAGYDEKSNPVSSGIAIVLKDSGVIITNYHLLAGATDLVFSKHNKIIKTSGIERVNVEQDIVVLKIANSAKKKFPSVSLGSASGGEKVLVSGKKDDGNFFTTETLVAAPQISEGRTDGLNSFATPVENGFVVSDLQGNLTGIVSPLKKGNTKSNCFIPIQEVFSFRKMPIDSVYSKSNFLLYQGLTAYEEGNYNSAHDFLSAYIKLVKDDATAYYFRGSARFHLERYADAITDYLISLKLDPGSARTFKASATTKKVAGEIKEAIDDYTKAIALRPADPEVYLARGALKGKLKDSKGAMNDFLEVIKLDPSNGEVYYYMGTEKMIAGDFKGAILDYDKALSLHFENAALFYNRGIAKQELKNPAGAIDDFTLAIQLNPKFVGAYLNRAKSRITQNDFTGAISDLDKAISINPEYADAYFNRGNAKAELKEYTAALADYNQAIKINPENSRAYFVRGNIKQLLGDSTGACIDWSKAGELGLTIAYDTIKANCK